MNQFSKKTLKRVRLHLEKLKSVRENYPYKAINPKPKNFMHLSIMARNRNLAKAILTELIFFNFELSKLSNKSKNNNKSFLYNQLFYKLLYKKRLFLTDDFYKNPSILQIKYVDYRKKKSYIWGKKIKAQLNLLLTKVIIKISLIFKAINKFCLLIKEDVIEKWYIYLARFLVISLIHFVPFFQLTSTLLYTQPNKHIAHPIISYFLNFFPPLVPLLKSVSPIVNQDTFSFLILAPYMYFFTYRHKRYNIPRKITYQGTLALMLMLVRYSLLISQEAAITIFKFAKRFVFLNNYENIELLRDDFPFYIDDLEDLRFYREEVYQLGESIFSLQNTTKLAKIYEATTIFSLLAVIALLYNYVYFIVRGKKPIIPVVTKTVQRMIVDRGNQES